jgi:hypothetical protein
MMVENGTFEMPVHNNPPCVPPNMQSHSYTPDTFAQSYVTINSLRVVLVSDSYSSDTTDADFAGTNTFVEVLV